MVGEGEEWLLVHQLTNEPDARSMEVPELNPFTYYRYQGRTRCWRRGAGAETAQTGTGFGPEVLLSSSGSLPTPHRSFRMRQVNIVGTSPPSQPSRKIQTLQAPPDMAPANVTLRTASETSLWLRWMVRLPQGQWG